jgi:glutamine amidotransferase
MIDDICIVDYKAGNLTSVKLALESIGSKAFITNSPELVSKAKKIIFPGVGSAKSAMSNLKKYALDEAIKEVFIRQVPFLGICLGAQIILNFSEEDGGTKTLELIAGRTKKFSPKSPEYKIPHIGWNSVRFLKNHPILNGIEDESEFYFVHSFYPLPDDPNAIIAQTDYAEVLFPSIIGKENLLACQFHPEKSGRIGLKLLENFCKWSP